MIVWHAGTLCPYGLHVRFTQPVHSGCITSAESVLITMQSHTEVLNFLENNPPPTSPDHKVPVISIAPQCLASLAASISSTSSQTLSLLQVLRRVAAFCQSVLGFAHVYDTTFARHISLLEHAKEFAERKQGQGKLPMLASACPGWVCYAEKTHSEMLPFISQTKSPQQVMGTLVKEWLGAKWGKQCVSCHSDYAEALIISLSFPCAVHSTPAVLMDRRRATLDLSSSQTRSDIPRYSDALLR